MSTQCPCTKTVRNSDQICQISNIWQSEPLPLTMYPIVEIMASPPAMNTHSKKQHLPHNHPIHQNVENGMAIINTAHYFFTLPNTLDNHMYVHLVQQDTCPYNLQDLDPEELTERMRIKKNQARRRKMRKIRKEAEKIVQLKRELWLMHKWSWTEDGIMGIIWWNQEYWDMGMGIKRLKMFQNGLKIKKEEPLTPLLHIKVKSPPTPSLQYPPSSLSSSHICSIDPNNFVWSNNQVPKNITSFFSSSFGHLASDSVSPFVWQAKFTNISPWASGNSASISRFWSTTTPPF